MPHCGQIIDGLLLALLLLPVVGIRFDPLVVGVERRLEQQDGGDATRHLGDVARLVGRQVAAQQRALTVGQPLLDDLVAADRVAPDPLRACSASRRVVQVDIEQVPPRQAHELLEGEAEVAETFAEGASSSAV